MAHPTVHCMLFTCTLGCLTGCPEAGRAAKHSSHVLAHTLHADRRQQLLRQSKPLHGAD